LSNDNSPSAARPRHVDQPSSAEGEEARAAHAETERQIALAWAEVTALIARDAFVMTQHPHRPTKLSARWQETSLPLELPEDRAAGLDTARALAVAGGFQHWRAVRDEMVRLGHGAAAEWFAAPAVQIEFDALCNASGNVRVLKRG
jgi:hypothetical protein